MPQGTPPLDGWTSATITGDTPDVPPRQAWYATFHLAAAGADGRDINYEVHRRIAHDNVNDAF